MLVVTASARQHGPVARSLPEVTTRDRVRPVRGPADGDAPDVRGGAATLPGRQDRPV